MSNDVEIVVSDKHVTRGGFGAAKKEVKDLAKDVRDADKDSRSLGKSLGDIPGRLSSIGKGLGSLPGQISAIGTKAADSLSKGFTKGVDGVTEALPKALSNPYVLAAAAAAGVFVGAAVGGAVVTGMGAGLAGLGMSVAAKAPAVKSAISQLSSELSGEMTQISKPFEKTWVDWTGSARRGFSTLKPELAAVFRDTAAEVSRFGDSMSVAVTKFGPALQPIGKAFSAVLADLGGRMPGVVDGLADSFGDLARSIERNPEALGKMIELMGKLGQVTANELKDANEIFANFTGGGAIGEELEMISNFFSGEGYKTDAELGKNAKEGLDGLKESASTAFQPVDTIRSAIDAVGDAADGSAEQINAIGRALDILNGQTPEYTDALADAANALDGIGGMFDDVKAKANGFGNELVNQSGQFNVTNENGRKLYETTRSMSEQFDHMAEAVRNGQMSREQFITDTSRMRDGLNETWRQGGLTEAQIAHLNDVMRLTPDDLNTTIRVHGAAQAESALNDIARAREAQMWVTYYASNSVGTARGGPNRMYAHGGITSTAATGGMRGGDVIMNEQGPERVRLPDGSQVVPAGTSRELDRRWMEGSGGGTTIEWIGGPSDELGRAIYQYVQKNMRVRGAAGVIR